MEENTNISLLEKLKNAIENIKQMMQSDKRVFFGVIGMGVLVLVFLIIVSISLFFSRKGISTTETPNTAIAPNSNNSLIPTSKPKIPTYLSLVITNAPKTYKVNDTITFTVVGDSGGQQVRGYDAVFKYDPRKVSFVSEKNLYSPFAYRKRIRGDWVIVTGIQPQTSAKKTIFSKTPLMSVSFKAIAPGTAYFPLSYVPDSFNDSNLIDTNSNDMLSKGEGITIQIMP